MLCASDPYPVVGAGQSFGLQPNVVTGMAISTTAGVERVEKLTGVLALNLAGDDSLCVYCGQNGVKYYQIWCIARN